MKRTPLKRGASTLKRSGPIKSRRTKATPLRQGAKGKPCQIRIPGYCTGVAEETVLAHYRMQTGAGMKPPDSRGAHGCRVCHDIVDFRLSTSDFSNAEIRLMHAEGVFRTQELGE